MSSNNTDLRRLFFFVFLFDLGFSGYPESPRMIGMWGSIPDPFMHCAIACK